MFVSLVDFLVHTVSIFFDNLRFFEVFNGSDSTRQRKSSFDERVLGGDSLVLEACLGDLGAEKVSYTGLVGRAKLVRRSIVVYHGVIVVG